MFASHIEPDDLKLLPLRCFEGPVHVVENRRDARVAVRVINNYRELGFDTETKPSFKKGRNNPVSLMQLAAGDQVWLFRLNRLGNIPELGVLCANSEILKIGAAIRDDIKPLKNLFQVEPAGFIDLQHFVHQFGIQNFSLKKLSAIVLGFRISKSQQLSNWDADSLTEAQVRYAATDAWVSLLIYQKLIQAQNAK